MSRQVFFGLFRLSLNEKLQDVVVVVVLIASRTKEQALTKCQLSFFLTISGLVKTFLETTEASANNFYTERN